MSIVRLETSMSLDGYNRRPRPARGNDGRRRPGPVRDNGRGRRAAGPHGRRGQGRRHLQRQQRPAGAARRARDESRIHLVPVLFGAGTRLFEDIGTEHVQLQIVEVIEETNATHLRYAIRRR
jgi:hypothetical protein